MLSVLILAFTISLQPSGGQLEQGINLNQGRCRSVNTWSWAVVQLRHPPTIRSYTGSYSITKKDSCSDLCHPDIPILPGEDRAPELKRVRSSFFGKENAKGETTTTTTCLNVTYEINRHSASKTKGLEFTLRMHNNIECHRYLLNFTTALSYDAVYVDDRSRTGGNRIFHFDCFCDLQPHQRYQLAIRPLPVSVINCRYTDDQRSLVDISIPGCSDDSRTWIDTYCPQLSRWQPKLFMLRQGFSENSTLEVTFDTAPDEFGISTYNVFLMDMYPLQQGDCLKTETHLKHEGIMTMLNVSTCKFRWMTGELGFEAYITIVPLSSPETPKPSITGPRIQLQGDPCHGALGCTSLTVCAVTTEGNYDCRCQEGTISIGRYPCIADPCYSSPCNGTEECNVTTTGPRIGFSCICESGTMCEDSPPLKLSKKSIRVGIVPVVVIGITAAVLVILTTVICTYVCRTKACRCIWNVPVLYPVCENENPEGPPEPGEDERCIPALDAVDLQKPLVLFSYPEDNPGFVGMVEKLANFLLSRGCTLPILPSQQTIEIGKKGPEQWLAETAQKADKILWMCSHSSTSAWQDLRADQGGNDETARRTRGAFGNMFATLVRLTKDERETEVARGKHAVGYFSALSSLADIPPIFNDLPRFDLLCDLEDMCFYLHGLEKSTPRYRSHMPEISGEMLTTERRVLERTLKQLAATSRNRNKRLDQIPVRFAPTPKSKCQVIQPRGHTPIRLKALKESSNVSMKQAWELLTISVDGGSDSSGEEGNNEYCVQSHRGFHSIKYGHSDSQLTNPASHKLISQSSTDTGYSSLERDVRPSL